jgi:uncharacterized protein YndB with AHSA1/START domain
MGVAPGCALACPVDAIGDGTVASTLPQWTRDWSTAARTTDMSGMVDMPGWGNVPCTVLEAEPDERLVYTFADWTLTWQLQTEGTGTRLFLEHAGFDLDIPHHRFAFDHMGPGWRDEVLPRLAGVVAPVDT